MIDSITPKKKLASNRNSLNFFISIFINYFPAIDGKELILIF